jgi:ferredoxin-thioredoxin reductase catalytic subunit
MSEIKDEDIEAQYKRLNKSAESAGYHLNSDVDFTKEIIKGLLLNENRYGYWACPCRLASGIKKEDLDIICPCDYRDDDLNEHGSCYCALYVSKDILDGKKELIPVPERRPPESEIRKMKGKNISKNLKKLSKPVWRCKVCGYLCGRETPPEVCPICKAKKERFEIFM